jgi:NhaP-type Na+/H+ or K+/H+ antiporter
LEKVGLFWKKPYFFFKRLKLDNLKKSRAFSKKALLFPEKALLFRLKLRTQESHNFHTGFILATIVLCFLYRFIGTFLLSALVNLGRAHKIQLKEQIIMGYGGLRGAVGFSLAVVLSQVSNRLCLIGCGAQSASHWLSSFPG